MQKAAAINRRYFAKKLFYPCIIPFYVKLKKRVIGSIEYQIIVLNYILGKRLGWRKQNC